MSFKESINNYLAALAEERPKTFIWGLRVLMIGCVVGSYILMDYIANTFPGIGTFLIFVLGVPSTIGVIILVLYIIWKIWKGIGWLMDQPSYGSWWGSIWVPNPFERFLNTLANNKVVINIETSKSKLEAKTESEDNTDPDTITSPVSGKDV